MSTSAPPIYDGPAPGEETETVESLPIVNAAMALSAAERGAIDIQITTAKQYPRSVDKALKEALTLATMDEVTAESMFYTLERKEKNERKFISGPSVRLAEVLAYAWTNLRVDGDIESEDGRFVNAVGTCFDLERNVAMRTRTRRRITNKNGVRYGDDMVAVTANAAVSLAVRNAIVRVIPRVFVDRIYNEARRAALGDAKTMSSKRQNGLAWFRTHGATDAQVFALLNVKGIDDVGEEQYLTLRGLMNSVKEGATTIEQLFRAPTSDGTADLNAALGINKPAASATPEPKSTEAPQ